MILLTIGLILAYTNNYHVLDKDDIMGILAVGVVEGALELLFVAKAIGVI